MHTYGYTEGLGFKDVVVPAWAAGFSAFGCACADFEYRYDKSVDLAVPQHAAENREGAGRGDHPDGLVGTRRQGDRGVPHQRLRSRKT